MTEPGVPRTTAGRALDNDLRKAGVSLVHSGYKEPPLPSIRQRILRIEAEAAGSTAGLAAALEGLRALSDAATASPWHAYIAYSGESGEFNEVGIYAGAATTHRDENTIISDFGFRSENMLPDLEFVVAAVDFVRAALAASPSAEEWKPLVLGPNEIHGGEKGSYVAASPRLTPARTSAAPLEPTCSSCGKVLILTDSLYCHDDYWRIIGLMDEARLAAPAAPLDVERLARALCEGEDIDQQNDYGDYANLTTARKYAAAIAAAYSAQGEKPTPLLTYTDPAGGPDWEPRRDEA